MKPSTSLFCKRASWRGRRAYLLGNEALRLTTLLGGGHVADFRLVDSTGSHSVSPLWVPPWRTIEPYQYRQETHSRTYGTITEGKLLSGLVGHNICLDYFGSPSVEEARVGLSQHGEAAWSKWVKKGILQSQNRIALTLSTRLPVSGLRFSREISLRHNDPIVYFKETVLNERRADHFFHWTQHITLGPPFLSASDALVAVPGTRGITHPHGYDEGKALLSSNEVFRWPKAPLVKGGTVDLTRTLLRPGLGFVATVLLDQRRSIGYIAGINRKLGLLIAYCFKRSDFPWVAIWEENLGITAPPWKRRTRARGLEFSTTPLPVERREAFLLGKVFGQPTLTCVPAMGRRTVHYISLLTPIPQGFGNVLDIDLAKSEILIQGSMAERPVVIKASGLNSFLE